MICGAGRSQCGMLSEEFRTSHMTAPLRIGGRVIGALCVGSPAINQFADESREMLTKLANVAAIALENARLVHESRQLAIRERMLAEINSKIWASNTIDAVLQTAIKEIGRRLDASTVSIELKLDEES